MSGAKTREQRWEEEAAAFDRQADRTAEQLAPLSSPVLRRYANPRRIYSKEFRFKILGDLRGQSVLDAGCNDGENSMLLARFGASVTGIDISPKSIELANRRAALEGVSGSARFLCSPLETAELPDNSFDIIWCHSFLHHVIEELPLVLGKLTGWVKPGGKMVFSEPANLAPFLRRLRLLVPVPSEGTPGERPLEQREIELIRGYFRDMRIRPFSLLARLSRLILSDGNYEGSGWPKRLLLDALSGADYVILSLPGSRNLAGYLVMYGHPRK